MTSIKLHSHVGRDGILKFELPVGLSETDVEVMVIFQPIKSVPESKETTPEDLGWPPGFFDETFGSLRAEPMVREPQGEYEVREELK